MRFIYLSTTNEDEFKTNESTIDSFKEYLYGDEKFYVTESKIDKNKFVIGEDIFFLRAEKEFGYYTYKVVAYCRSASILEDSNGNIYPHYFVINSSTLRIFVEGINIRYIQNFINDNNHIKQVNFTGSITGNKFTGSQSWIYFDKEDSVEIMEWFRKTILDENIQMLCNL